MVRPAPAPPHRRDLPEDLVTRMADALDPDVRHLLAHHHPLAPPDVVLDAFPAIRADTRSR